ncbi:MAG TPA: DUF1778 domain-containing protein [Steroidobacteraceae bacterium]|jgi:hypothetical protein
MANPAKTEQLQIRVSRAEKAAIRRAAARAGLDASAYVLSQVLPAPAAEFQRCAEACAGPQPRFALAEINSLLAGFSAGELGAAVAEPPTARLSAFLLNYVAAMVEHTCARRAVPIPRWTGAVRPLSEPVFGSELQSLRLHLLTQSPLAFRCRNIFIDASVGERV